MKRQWQCICKEWVDCDYPSHTHAGIRKYYDQDEKKWHNTIGMPMEIWTYERQPNRPVRECP